MRPYHDALVMRLLRERRWHIERILDGSMKGGWHRSRRRQLAHVNAEIARRLPAAKAERAISFRRLKANLLDELRQCAVEIEEAGNLLRPNLPGTASLFDAAADRVRMAIVMAEGAP